MIEHLPAAVLEILQPVCATAGVLVALGLLAAQRWDRPRLSLPTAPLPRTPQQVAGYVVAELERTGHTAVYADRDLWVSVSLDRRVWHRQWVVRVAPAEWSCEDAHPITCTDTRSVRVVVEDQVRQVRSYGRES